MNQKAVATKDLFLSNAAVVQIPNSFPIEELLDFELSYDDGDLSSGFLQVDEDGSSYNLVYDSYRDDPQYKAEYHFFAEQFVRRFSAFSDTEMMGALLEELGYASNQCLTEESLADVNDRRLRVATINTYKMYGGDVLKSGLLESVVRYFYGNSVPVSLQLENVLHPFPDPFSRRAALISYLSSLDVNVAVLQEVLSDYMIKDVLTLINDRREQNGLEPFYLEHFSDETEGVSALAVLSTYPIVDADFVKTKWQGSFSTRCELGFANDYFHGFGHVTIEKDGRLVDVVAVHNLPHEDPGLAGDVYADDLASEREIYWLELRDYVSRFLFKNRPVVIAGDFNSNPHQRGYESFTEQFPEFENVVLTSMDDDLETYGQSSFHTGARWIEEQELPDMGLLDHVFVSGAETIYGFIDHRAESFSDHDAIVTEVLLDDANYFNFDEDPRFDFNPSQDQLADLRDYFDDAPISWVCDYNPFSGIKNNQRARTLATLDHWASQDSSSLIVSVEGFTGISSSPVHASLVPLHVLSGD